MTKSIIKSVLKKLFLVNIKKSIPDDDLIGKQRLNLFIIFSFTVTLALSAIAYQVVFVFNIKPILAYTVYVLIGIIIFNYFLLNWHKRRRVAVIVSVLACFLALHYITYFAGGIRNSGMFYLSALTLVTFMLLGSREGKWFTVLSIIHIIYFYFVTEYTTWVNYDFIGYENSLINQDYLFTGLISVFLVGSLINNLESNKNIIIASITESRNKLAENNRELEKLSLVASKTDNGVAITDSNGNIEWVNDGFTRLTNYSNEDCKGKSMFELLNGIQTDLAIVQEVKEQLKKNEAVTADLLNYKKDGSTTWIHENITPILNDKGRVARYIFIMSDINERRLTEIKMEEYLKSLEKSNKELDQFAYVVSHDLKAPLRTIGNLSDWILEDAAKDLDSQSQENFNLIRGRVKRMEQLINGILEYSKSTKAFEVENFFSMNEIVADAVEMVASPHNCQVEVASNMPLYFGDKTKYKQVFLNFISNAVKHNDKPKIKIEIKCKELDHFWKFSITDNGPGIDPKYHERIFVIFQTLKARDEFESTGVGLAIVKKIVEEAGGKIWLESEIGEGTTFNFILPKQKANGGNISQTPLNFNVDSTSPKHIF